LLDVVYLVEGGAGGDADQWLTKPWSSTGRCAAPYMGLAPYCDLPTF